MKTEVINNITDINQNLIYEGYLWPSDKSEPLVCNNENLKGIVNVSDYLTNPFIVEGFLYSRSDNTSFTIKYTDGEYFIRQYSDITVDKKNVKTYLSNRMNDRKLRFLQNWIAVPDGNCCGFEVLQPSEVVFVGFEK